jgi:hypothetical protein
MMFQRLTSFGFTLVALPLLAACNQTAAPAAAPEIGDTPAATPGVVGSGAIAAIMDMQQTQARHRLESTVATRVATFDRKGLSAYANKEMHEEQSRVQQQKLHHSLEEINKALEEAKALQALSEDLERQKASSASKPRRQQANP